MFKMVKRNGVDLMSKDVELEFIKEQLKPIIKKIKQTRLDNQNLAKPEKLFEGKFTTAIYSRLNACLRRERTESIVEATRRFSDIDYLHNRYCDILDLTDWICSDAEVIYFMDKQTLCAFLRINLDSYQQFLEDDSYPEIKDIFVNMEEYLISATQTASEINARSNSAVQRRLALKGKNGGHGVEYHSKKDILDVVSNIIDAQQMQNKLQTTYDFLSLGDTKNKK